MKKRGLNVKELFSSISDFDEKFIILDKSDVKRLLGGTHYEDEKITHLVAILNEAEETWGIKGSYGDDYGPEDEVVLVLITNLKPQVNPIFQEWIDIMFPQFGGKNVKRT